MRRHVLVVEDDETVRHVVRHYLEAAGHRVTCTDDGQVGLNTALESNPDVVVLDINLPGMNGFEVARQVRQETDTYIIMLTARGEELDRIYGLEIGADDYIVKPFSPRELVARITAALRRQKKGENQPLKFAHLTIDTAAHEITTPNGYLELTTTEFNILLELARHAGQVLSREQLLTNVWGSNYVGNDRVVDVYVNQVRRKLEEKVGKPLITTVWGVGYKFKDA